jgi:hypothetical protein
MSGYPVEAISEKPDEKNGARPAYRVLFDGQCEICQSSCVMACVSWLRTLDREKKTICLPISQEVLAAVDSRLQMDECLRQVWELRKCSERNVGYIRLFSTTTQSFVNEDHEYRKTSRAQPGSCRTRHRQRCWGSPGGKASPLLTSSFVRMLDSGMRMSDFLTDCNGPAYKRRPRHR